MALRVAALAGATLLAFTLTAAAQESGGATSGGATSSAPSAPPMQPAPPPPPPPAAPPAAEQMTMGWYAGLGAGWIHQDNISATFPGAGPPFPFHTSNGAALVTGTFGYRFHDRLRIEGEIGWDRHDFSATEPSEDGFGGHNTIWSMMANAAYDFPLSNRFDFTVGAGAGIGEADFEAATSGPGSSMSSSNQGFMWQAFTGFDYWVCNNVSLNVDLRYRNLAENQTYQLNYTGGGSASVQVKGLNEKAIMFSARWYPWAAN
jgi:opacity protein-like surface antigen